MWLYWRLFLLGLAILGRGRLVAVRSHAGGCDDLDQLAALGHGVGVDGGAGDGAGRQRGHRALHHDGKDIIRSGGDGDQWHERCNIGDPPRHPGAVSTEAADNVAASSTCRHRSVGHDGIVAPRDGLDVDLELGAEFEIGVLTVALPADTTCGRVRCDGGGRGVDVIVSLGGDGTRTDALAMRLQLFDRVEDGGVRHQPPDVFAGSRVDDNASGTRHGSVTALPGPAYGGLSHSHEIAVPGGGGRAGADERGATAVARRGPGRSPQRRR